MSVRGRSANRGGWTSLVDENCDLFCFSLDSVCKNTQNIPTSRSIAMPSKDDSTDAVHIRFRDKEHLKQFYCFDCSQTFSATQLLDVFQHYKDTQHVQFYCNCLYCDGRVYQYRDGDHQIQFYHNCFRWKQGLDRWTNEHSFIPRGFTSIYQ